jgi:hypothetical protein
MFSLMFFTALFWPAAGGPRSVVASRDAQWLRLQQRQCRLRSIGSCEQVRIGISRSPGKKPGPVVQLQLK